MSEPRRYRRQLNWALASVAMCVLAPRPALALDRLCDTRSENCRVPLMDMIKAEQVAIDVGMWFMEDSRFSTELIRRKQAGVQIRILMDPRSNTQHPAQVPILAALTNAGIPMRKRVASGIEHWKVMIFEGQQAVYFGSANFSDDAFVPAQPYVNYVDESVYFTDDPPFVDALKTAFDDAWINTGSYANYNAHVSTLTRRYPIYPMDPELNLPPGSDFINRVVGRLNAERTRIDVMMYRIADDRATNALIAAKLRLVPIRLLVDPSMYHDPTRLDVSHHFDRLYAAGVPMKVTAHAGINHGKLTLLYGQRMTIFGSSNWTTPSGNSQHENNYFTKKSFIFDYFVTYFNNRWNNNNPAGVPDTKPFVPLPPDKPLYNSPANLLPGVASTGVRLRWDGGKWAQTYDIHLGTTPTPPVVAANVSLGPSRTPTEYKSFTLPALAPGTTYYWKIVSRTPAGLTRNGSVWSFTTGGSPPPLPSGAVTVVLRPSSAPVVQGSWVYVPDGTAAGGAALQNPDAGQAKIAPALASPSSYFEMTFNATAGVAYHVWLRMKAVNNSTANDSVHVQFNGSMDAVGNAVARIGTTASFEPVIQDGSGAPLPQGWGWTDNGYGSHGPHVYFAQTGTQTIRIQQREDGARIDQIVISPAEYLLNAPGGHYNDTTIVPVN